MIHNILQINFQLNYIEILAVIFGITSVWFSKKENVLVYPLGLLNTVFYIYISLQASLIGEAIVNLYYTIISFYGWYLWVKKKNHIRIVIITKNTKKEWINQICSFIILYVIIYILLIWCKEYFYPGAIPIFDGLASSTAFIGMYLMAKKKVESWYWWICTNMVSIPLYFVKGLYVTSLYYVILFVLAFGGLVAWRKKVLINQSK